jgi:hypothetical protein
MLAIIWKHVDNRSYSNKFILISNKVLFPAPTNKSRYKSEIIYISSCEEDKRNQVRKSVLSERKYATLFISIMLSDRNKNQKR